MAGRICKRCGTEFDAATWNQSFCSRRCYIEHRTEKDRLEHGYAAVLGTTGTCAICGKPYLRGKHNQMTCSPECRKEMEAIRHSRRRKGAQRIVQWEKVGTCVMCGTTFSRDKTRHSKKVCSDACRIAYKRQLDHESYARRYAQRPDKPVDKGPHETTIGAWGLSFDPYCAGMTFAGFDMSVIPATSAQALPVY